jgi:hypothetical protein
LFSIGMWVPLIRILTPSYFFGYFTESMQHSTRRMMQSTRPRFAPADTLNPKKTKHFIFA